MKENIKAVLFDVDGTLFDRGLAQGKVLEIIVRQFSHIFGAFEIERVAKAFAESDRVATEEFEAGAPSNSLRRKRSRLFLQLLGLPENEISSSFCFLPFPLATLSMAGSLSIPTAIGPRCAYSRIWAPVPQQTSSIRSPGLKSANWAINVLMFFSSGSAKVS